MAPLLAGFQGIPAREEGDAVPAVPPIGAAPAPVAPAAVSSPSNPGPTPSPAAGQCPPAQSTASPQRCGAHTLRVRPLWFNGVLLQHHGALD